MERLSESVGRSASLTRAGQDAQRGIEIRRRTTFLEAFNSARSSPVASGEKPPTARYFDPR